MSNGGSRLPVPGEVLARKYRIERLLGRGGFGAVFLARHEILQQPLAIKVLLPEVSADPETAERFLNEARAAALIRNEHAAAVLDVDRLDDGTAFMVLEYLHGRDLESFFAERGPLPAEQAVAYLLQAMEAVAQAHVMGIVHRDLKLANLFLAERLDGGVVVKVLDFGISKIASASIATAAGAVIGSPGFMPPEQVRSSRDVDPRADLWSIGVILYTLLSGRMPFVGETAPAVFAAILETTPLPLQTLRPDLPAGLDRVIERCLQRDRELRHRDVGELAAALAPFGGPEGAHSVQRIQQILAGQVLSPAAVTDPALGPTYRRAPVVSSTTVREREPAATAPVRRLVAPLLIGLLLALATGAGVVYLGAAELAGPDASGPLEAPAAVASAPEPVAAPPLADAAVRDEPRPAGGATRAATSARPARRDAGVAEGVDGGQDAGAAPADAGVRCLETADCPGFTVCVGGECVRLGKSVAPCARFEARTVPADFEPLRGTPPPPLLLSPADRGALWPLRFRVELRDGREYPCTLWGRAGRAALHTHDSVPATVQALFETALRNAGVKLTRPTEQSDAVVSVVLVKALAVEQAVGEVVADVALRRAGGTAPLWTGELRGTAKAAGRSSLNAALNDASVDLARRLLESEPFLVAARAAFPPGPAPASSTPVGEASTGTSRRPVARPRVTLTDEEIAQAIAAAKEELRACTQEARSGATLEMRFEVRGDGSVANVQCATPEFQKTRLSACLTGVLRSVRFPGYSGPPMRPVTYPFRF